MKKVNTTRTGRYREAELMQQQLYTRLPRRLLLQRPRSQLPQR